MGTFVNKGRNLGGYKAYRAADHYINNPVHKEWPSTDVTAAYWRPGCQCNNAENTEIRHWGCTSTAHLIHHIIACRARDCADGPGPGSLAVGTGASTFEPYQDVGARVNHQKLHGTLLAQFRASELSDQGRCGDRILTHTHDAMPEPAPEPARTGVIEPSL